MRSISISVIILGVTTVLSAQNTDLKNYYENLKEDTIQLILIGPKYREAYITNLMNCLFSYLKMA